MTGKPDPNCLSYHSHPIRPCGAPSPTGEDCDTGIPSSKQATKPPPYKPSPHGEGGQRQRWIGCFRKQHKCVSLFPILSSVFHAIVTLSAPAGHLPLEGKAAIRESHLLKKAAHHPFEPIRSPSTVIPSAAEGSLLHCRHMHTCALTQTTPWCFLFRLSLTHVLPVCKKDPSTSALMTRKKDGSSHIVFHIAA